MIRQIVELPCDFAPLCTIPRTHRCQYLALGILPPRWPCERMRSQHWARIAFLRSKKCQIFAKGESFIADLNKIVSSSHAAIRTVPKKASVSSKAQDLDLGRQSWPPSRSH